MRTSKILFVVSWVLLMFLALMIVLGSIASAGTAFRGRDDRLGTVTTEQMRTAGGDDAVKAVRGRRLTAATWALAFGILFGWVVAGPYRQGRRWAWWALLISLGVPELASLARAPLIGTTVGTLEPAMVLVFLLLGLMAGAPKTFSSHITGLDSVD